jgi:hypothetical protein
MIWLGLLCIAGPPITIVRSTMQDTLMKHLMPSPALSTLHHLSSTLDDRLGSKEHTRHTESSLRLYISLSDLYKTFGRPIPTLIIRARMNLGSTITYPCY